MERSFGATRSTKGIDNRESDILDSDDYFGHHGGARVATVQALTGAEPKAFVGDSTSPRCRPHRTLQEETGRIFPHASSARGRTGSVRCSGTATRSLRTPPRSTTCWGFDATAGVIPDWMCEEARPGVRAR